MALERRGVQEGWLILRDHLLQAQERPILTNKKSSKGSKRPGMDEQGAPKWTRTSKGSVWEVEVLISLLVFWGLMSLNYGTNWLLINFLKHPSDKTTTYCMYLWAYFSISSSQGQHQDLKQHSSAERNRIFISVKHTETEQKVCWPQHKHEDLFEENCMYHQGLKLYVMCTQTTKHNMLTQHDDINKFVVW